ncbi:DUF6528 family protein [Kitasatospora sp. NPDC052896]|uniref:DUF6528 family protein n=1 Tax=Kitasatospora sp. NPDC052896 TaxID=3364061 RepID=UPI0037C90F29
MSCAAHQARTVPAAERAAGRAPCTTRPIRCTGMSGTPSPSWGGFRPQQTATVRTSQVRISPSAHRGGAGGRLGGTCPRSGPGGGEGVVREIRWRAVGSGTLWRGTRQALLAAAICGLAVGSGSARAPLVGPGRVAGGRPVAGGQAGARGQAPAGGQAVAGGQAGGRSGAGGRVVAESRIVAVDQGSRSVVVLDPSGDDAKVRWSWSADQDPGLADLRPATSWTNPSEAKSRQLDGQRYLLTAASGGLAAVVAYPTAEVHWATNAGDGNVHSLELLPDGNVAVVASTAGWLRLYAASQGPRADHFVEYPLDGAHGVHFDPTSGLLWAVGDRELTAYEVSGPAAAPGLTKVRTTALPEGDGHDLGPVLSSPGRLWVTTGRHVWQYAPAQNTFTPVRLSNAEADEDVKSVGDDPRTGRILAITPAEGGACDWCTSVLTFYRRDATRTLNGTQLYKARWWTSRQ